jgi:hypothetical protein
MKLKRIGAELEHTTQPPGGERVEWGERARRAVIKQTRYAGEAPFRRRFGRRL